MTSLQEQWKEKNRQIEQLKQENNALVDEYVKLDEKHRTCVQDGKDKQREIDRLNNLINTLPNIQIQNLERQVREWRHLALTLSAKIHNGTTLQP